MPKIKTTTLLALLYVSLAVAVLWPASLLGSATVPGGQWTDVWNSLWSMDFAHRSVMAGSMPWHTAELGSPGGGSVLLPDFWGAVFAVPAVGLMGVAGAYSTWMVLQLAAAGLITHLFTAEWLQSTGLSKDAAQRAGLAAGASFLISPVLLAGVQCGTTEAVAGGWMSGAVWAVWRALETPSQRRTLTAGAALAAVTLSGWYTAVIAFVFAGVFTLMAWRRLKISALQPLGLGLLFAVPFALWTHGVHTDPGHLATRAPEILDRIRASFGAATPLGMVWPTDHADIAIGAMTDSGTGYLHTGYLGLVLLSASLLGLRYARTTAAPLALAGLLCAILSWGPGESGTLPFALIDGLPGARSLSLVWRLALGAALAVSMLAAAATRGRWTWVVGLLVLVGSETAVRSPVSDGIATTDAAPIEALQALQRLPPGVVITVPRQHAELWLQVNHRQAITGTINIRRSESAQAWIEMATEGDWKPASQAAREMGIRYVAVKQSEALRASTEAVVAHRLSTEAEVVAKHERWTVYGLW